MRKFSKTLLCMCVAVIAICSLSFVSSAYGDSLSSATTISLNKQYDGTISSTNSQDTFKFTISESGKIVVNAKAYMEYVNYYIYDADGYQLWSSRPYWNTVTEQSSINSGIYLTSGTYYLCVSQYYSRTGDYDFKLTFSSSNESFKEPMDGNNNKITTADKVSFSKTYQGMLAINDSTDFYKFTISTTGRVTIDSVAKMEYINIFLYDVDGNELWSSRPYWNTTSNQSVNSNSLYLNSGTYYLVFSEYYSRFGNYNFKLSFESSGESFKETGWGTNNSLTTADNISLNKKYKGALCFNDNQDMYKFYVSSNETIILSFNGKRFEYVNIYIFDSEGNQIWNTRPYWNTTSGEITLQQELYLSKGNYYISISEYYGRLGHYSFEIGIEPPAITSKITATQSTSAIRLNWNKVDGATGYRVYQYSPSKGKYVQIASVKDTTYKKATNLKPGTTYKFKIKAYKKLSDGTVIWGSASPAFTTATECKAPKITSVTSPSKSKATVKWSNVDGETGYQLYYSTKKTSGFKKVSSYSANKLAGSKTFSASASGKTIYFKVRAYKKVSGQTIYSEWSAVKSVKLK